MGFRFFRRIRLFPGAYLNLGKAGTSLSLGPRGMKTTISSKGIRHTFGVPGTGWSYQTPLKKWKDNNNCAPSIGNNSREQKQQQAVGNDYQKLEFSFLKKLICPKEEMALAKGIQSCILQDYSEAELYLRQALCYVDGAFTLGIVYLNEGNYAEAELKFAIAEQNPELIGEFYRKYELNMKIHIEISPYYAVDYEANAMASYLAHVKALQQMNRHADACKLLLTLYKSKPQDLDIMIFLAEIVLEKEPGNQQWMNAIINMTKNLQNDSYAHAVLLLSKAEAFDNIGMTDVAITTLTSVLSKKKDRPLDFILEVQYQRGVLFLKTGKKTPAKKDLNAVFSINPNYTNVNQLLAQM